MNLYVKVRVVSIALDYQFHILSVETAQVMNRTQDQYFTEGQHQFFIAIIMWLLIFIQ